MRSALARLAATWGVVMALTGSASGQSSSEILRDIEALQVVGSVLYVAAHPDDENTRLLAYLAGERGFDVTYLSLTRGGGGQNLIGTEQSEMLGVLRTGELLAARSIDGAQQRFTRARDFGYSKSAVEALEVWGKDAVLADVVQVVREVRPDVIITRFGPNDRSHGHHVASAILAEEAYELAADASYLRDAGEPWRAHRVVRNQSSWRIDDDTDTSGWVSMDVGGYDVFAGRSWGEVAAASRTMHKSQGFGSSPRFGPAIEYFSHVAGDPAEPGEDLFVRIATGIDRATANPDVARLLATAARRFDPRAPERSLRHLGLAQKQLPPIALEERIEDLMVDSAGLWLTARSEQPAVVPGGSLTVTVSALMRRPAGVTLRWVVVGDEYVEVDPTLVEQGGFTPATARALRTESQVDKVLVEHEVFTTELQVTLPDDVTQPHWLVDAPTAALYSIGSGEERTLAETPPPVIAVVHLDVAGRPLRRSIPVEYAWTDPVHGERRHPVEVLPPVTATFGQGTRLVPAGSTVPVTVTLRASAGPASGTLTLQAPNGSTVTPAEVSFELSEGQPEQTIALELQVGDAAGSLRAEVSVGDETWSHSRSVIDHPHLPRRTVLSPAQMQVVPLALDRGSVTRIGYLPGSGDTVPSALRDLGYSVDTIDMSTVRSGGLSAYDTVVLGIRALNTDEDLRDNRGLLYEWVASGGRLVVQYNTSNRWSNLGNVGPAPLQIGRGRVTDETAAMVPVDPEAAVLMTPNVLEASDFDGWVQERGLYFAESWDPAYQAVFEAHDPGEEPLQGALMVLAHGEGTFVYTGISFFRQLPAGVPGAARLLANILAAGSVPDAVGDGGG